jgi:hypothetical protein
MKFLNSALPRMLALIAATCFTAWSANAADAPRRENNYEITPFGGYMFGGKFKDPTDGSDRDVKEDTAFGLFADIVADVPERQYEFLFANQSTTVKGAVPLDLDIQYLHIGGTVAFMDNPRIWPYFGATVGATRFSPKGTALDDETKVSFSIGGGFKVPITDHVGLRFDARAFITLLDTEGNIFCVSDAAGGACRISAQSDTFVQYVAGLGITAAF